jgi:hypothetical protein
MVKARVVSAAGAERADTENRRCCEWVGSMLLGLLFDPAVILKTPCQVVESWEPRGDGRRRRERMSCAQAPRTEHTQALHLAINPTRGGTTGAMNEILDSSTSATAILTRSSRRRWLSRVGLLAFVAGLAGCAALRPESPLGYTTTERWEASKRERLGKCSRDSTIETREQALRCLGGFKTYRDTRACTDSAAWVSRVTAGIEVP